MEEKLTETFRRYGIVAAVHRHTDGVNIGCSDSKGHHQGVKKGVHVGMILKMGQKKLKVKSVFKIKTARQFLYLTATHHVDQDSIARRSHLSTLSHSLGDRNR